VGTEIFVGVLAEAALFAAVYAALWALGIEESIRDDIYAVVMLILCVAMLAGLAWLGKREKEAASRNTRRPSAKGRPVPKGRR